MNISNLLNRIKGIASSIKTVRSAYDGDIPTIWNTSEIEYSSFVVSIKSVGREDNVRTYNLVLYYGDRLMSDGRNKNSIWDDGVNTLQSVINKMGDELDCEISDPTFECFEQKFEDYLAGVFTRISVEIEDELGECSMDDEEGPEPPQPEPFDIEGYTFVDDTVLYSAAALTKKDKILSINDTTITEIGDGGYAFAGCKLLETITLPNLTSMVGNYNFYELSNLREVNLPALTTQRNGNYTYYSCVRLERVNLPNLTSIQSTSSMFSGCENLLEINVPKLSNTFGSSALTGCNKLRKLDITSSNNFPSLPTGFTDLIEVHFGSGQYLNLALNLSRWNPTNAYLTDSQSLLTPEDIQAGFTSNAEKLYYNLQHYFADLLPDRTGSGAGSITLNADMKTFINAQTGLGVKNTIENKNWIIA